MKKINLIWQTYNGDQTNFEYEYITEILFKNFEQNKIFDDGKLSTIMDNSVIIYSNNSSNISSEFNEYLDKFIENGYSFYLLHLSNENLEHNCEYYSKANYVFRNYYDSNIDRDNLMFIPLGFKSGFIKKHNEISNKKYNISFIGQEKSDRSQLLEVIKEIDNVFIHKTNSWNCPTSLNQSECINIYKTTKFVPCPMGFVHPDSFRLMECLESGSIPVLKNYNNLEYFNKIWGESPLPVINHWEDLIEISKISDENYSKLNQKVQVWYENFKTELSDNIFNKIIKNYE